jgi:hypothetical protein
MTLAMSTISGFLFAISGTLVAMAILFAIFCYQHNKEHKK